MPWVIANPFTSPVVPRLGAIRRPGRCGGSRAVSPEAVKSAVPGPFFFAASTNGGPVGAFLGRGRAATRNDGEALIPASPDSPLGRRGPVVADTAASMASPIGDVAREGPSCRGHLSRPRWRRRSRSITFRDGLRPMARARPSPGAVFIKQRPETSAGGLLRLA